MLSPRRPPGAVGAALAAILIAAVVAACGGGGGDDERVSPAVEREIVVAVANHPQMEDIQNLTEELFTAKTGIGVNYAVLEEQTLREIVTRDVGAGGDQFDAVMIGPYEAPQFGASGWIHDLTSFAESDAGYDADDIIPNVAEALSRDGRLYAAPFSAESSFLMYRKDLLDAAGLALPMEPTWDQVADVARAIHTDEVAGICLRGKPGWGDLGATLTTVVNTFGGTWWEANPDGTPGEAQIDQPEFRDAVEFYVDLIDDAGPPDAAAHGYNECLSLYRAGKVAMWYDATVAAGNLEADDSPVKGKNGYVLAPTKVTDASGWLWSWALAIPANSPEPEAAWEFISFATGKEYGPAAAERLPGGYAVIPPGTRRSTYDLPGYLRASAPFVDVALAAMLDAPVDDPGTTPRPGGPGVQYVAIPEFQDVGTRCTQQISAAIAGSQSVDDALAVCQEIADRAVQ